MDTMLAARLHDYGSPLRIDRIPVPEPRPTEVLVRVMACGVVPNLQRVIGNFFATGTPDNKAMPDLPATFGLDPAGVIVKAGAQVRNLHEGDRVYVNPARSCGSCRMCRGGQPLDCPQFSFQGYFVRSRDIARDYPHGGLGQYLTAPASAIVKLSETMSFEQAARLGYLGTAYSALKKIGTGAGQTILINGISGQLGLCAALLALAMGARRVLGTGRNRALLDRVEAIAPSRIRTIALADDDDTALQDWTGKVTGGEGVDGVIDCLPPGAPARAMMRAMRTLRRGGICANVGAVMENLDMNAFWMMTNRYHFMGSVWFSTAEGEEMVALAEAGLLDLGVFEHRVTPLAQVNDVLGGAMPRDGGFTNYVIAPNG